jgi:hypothetical protein
MSCLFQYIYLMTIAEFVAALNLKFGKLDNQTPFSLDTLLKAYSKIKGGN